MGKIPKNLIEKQRLRKEETINSIKNAIDELESEGYLISIKLIMERTGLSRSVFNKPHVEKILAEKEIGKFKQIKKINIVEQDIRKKFILLEKELDKANLKASKIEEELKQKNTKIENLQLTNKELVETIEKLRGKMFVVMNKAIIKGIVFNDNDLYK